MPELTQEQINKLEKTHDEVIRIGTVLGDDKTGLCADVKDHGKRIHRIELILAASGILTASVLGIIKAVGG